MSEEDQMPSAYVVVDGSVIYELLPNSTLMIGRLDTNDIVLDDYKVSREHAMLKFAGEDLVLIDLASTHGTKLDGEKINQAVVEVGQRITIVSHELEVLEEKPEIEEGDTGVEEVSTASVRQLDRRVKFFGGLNEFPLITLVQFLWQEKQSGLLMLEEGQKPGPRLYFQNGEITHIADGERLGELLTRKMHEHSLFFYFHHETEFPERTIQIPTDHFLMELCAAEDSKERMEKTIEDAGADTSAPGEPATAVANNHAETARIAMPTPAEIAAAKQAQAMSARPRKTGTSA